MEESEIASFYHRIGTEIVFGGFVSCSESQEIVTQNYNGNVLMIIDTSRADRPGYKIKSLSVYPKELEVLLPPGQVYFVESIRRFSSIESSFLHEMKLIMTTLGIDRCGT